jgi:dTDP-4-amino-4,6-dideoxygalactose transaminase
MSTTVRPARRVLLSAPEVGSEERAALLAAFDGGWVAPVGPDLDAFEADLAAVTGRAHAVGLSSGTAALHLGLLALGVGAGDEVWVSTLTFVATANAVMHAGATPVLVDCDATWTMDVELVRSELDRRARSGARPPAAIVPVDLYGRCADHDELAEVAARHGVPVLVDAAEALGASYRGRPAGSEGLAAVLSFNGNKIVTTSGGGALVTDDAAVAARVRHLATQAREPVLHYEHRDVGFNQRLSNLLAALGRPQVARIAERVARRRAVAERYRTALADAPGVTFMPQPDADESARGTRPSWWLTCLTLEPGVARLDRDGLIAALAAEGVETRPVWKPMHLQPVYAGAPVLGGAVAARLFQTGVTLPYVHETPPHGHAGLGDEVAGLLAGLLGADGDRKPDGKPAGDPDGRGAR